MTTASKTAPVTITIPANSARLAAEELYQSARQARDNGEDALADILEQAASALHEAGWNATR